MSVSPPRPKGPPLNALRAFEAAARLGGFLAAAEELGVTPGAISQHIKTLEAWSGAALFVRRSQGVALTAHGADVAAGFTAAFDALGLAVRALRSGAEVSRITIAALPSVAQLWLAPRLPAIRAALPECRISVVALEKRPNLNREPFDLSLFLDVARPGDQVLMQDELTPVCAPELAARCRNGQIPGDEPLISDATWAGDWALWAGRDAPEVVSGQVYSLYSLAVGEAEAGAGILIGHTALIGNHLARGRLVDPFGVRVRSGLSLNLEIAARLPAESRIAKLAAWLRHAAGANYDVFRRS